MVYVGANDGMLHAFDAETGDEDWAFVPEFALPRFADMADSFYCHNYTCDQTVTVKDVKINGAWRTVLVAGGGGGGVEHLRPGHHLSRTPRRCCGRPDLPNGMKYHSEVEIASIGGKSMALVGSGLDMDNMEAYLYAYDLSNGDLLGEAVLSEDMAARATRPASPAMVDINLDGETDLVYMADCWAPCTASDSTATTNPDNWDIDRAVRRATRRSRPTRWRPTDPTARSTSTSAPAPTSRTTT